MRIAVPIELTPETARPRGGELIELSGPTMGVTWRAQFLAPPGLKPAVAASALQDALNLVVAQMGGWEPDSTLSRSNAAPSGGSHVLPAAMYRVVERALYWAEASDGAFDPTLAGLVDLWGFGPAGSTEHPPADDVVKAARVRSGWRRLQLDPAKGALAQPGGLTLDLSGIAKGFGLDVAGHALERLGVRDYLVEIGGELMGAGVKGDGSPWWVDVEAPPGLAIPEGPLRIALHGLAIATSGDYRRFVDRDGRRLSHTLDPRTGAPVTNGVVSTTALAATGMDADAVATILFVLGPEDGMAFAAEHDLAAQVIFQRDGVLREQVSPALAAMLD